MRNNLSQQIWEILACPNCGGNLSKIDNGCRCSDCQEEFYYSSKNQLDFRLKRKKVYQLQMDLGTDHPPGKGFDFINLKKNSSPQLDFSNVEVPHHLSKELLSYFPKAKQVDSMMLDLGCGEAIHKEVCEYAGFQYVGFDYYSVNAQIRGDAHALPFKDNTFEFILAIAVLEHIQFPLVMLKEVYRVLKPGGKFIGTVAFLEPFHGNSFYHHTHLGTFNSLKSAGFNIEYIAPNSKWTVLIAQARILFPKLPRSISKFLVQPLNLIHKLYWKIGGFISKSVKAAGNSRILFTTGAFAFIANKGNRNLK